MKRTALLLFLLYGTALAKDPLKDLTSPNVDVRLRAVNQLEDVEVDQIAKDQKRVDRTIRALVAAIDREKELRRRCDEARALRLYLAASQNREEHIQLVLPLLTDREPEVVLYTWQGLRVRNAQPLSAALRQRLVAFLDHPKQQVKINALLWLVAESGLAEQRAGEPLQAKPAEAFQAVLKAANSSEPRLRTTAVRFLTQHPEIDRGQTMAVLRADLPRPAQDEEDFVTLESVDAFLFQSGLEAHSLLEALEQARPKYEKMGALAVYYRTRSSLGPWRQPSGIDFEAVPSEQMTEIAEGLAEQGPHGRAELNRLFQKASHSAEFESWAPNWAPILARGGATPESAPVLVRLLEKQPTPEFIAALSTAGPGQEAVLLKFLEHSDPNCQEAAAYSLACLGLAPDKVRAWIPRGVSHAGPRCGLLLGVLRRLPTPATLPANFQAETGEQVFLARLLGSPASGWQNFRSYLAEDHLPARCWRSRTLADKEATLAALELLLADPTMTRGLPAIALMAGSPDPELAGAAQKLMR